jgi:tetrahydromethanopterin S-methyltransferase subunit H
LIPGGHILPEDNNKYELRDVFKVGDIIVGGRKSEFPCVLVGSIFYMRHKIVKDEMTGDFDESAAAKLIEESQAVANRLGVGLMFDVIGSTTKALVKYIRFIKKVGSTPIMINSTSQEVRMEAVMELAELGLTDGLVYNSINTFTIEKEIDILSKVPIAAAVVQAYNIKSKNPDGPLKALIGTGDQDGLLEMVRRCGIRNIMIDVPILDLSSVGLTGYSARIIKDRLSVPVGAAPANAVFTNQWLMDRNQVSFEKFRMLNAVTSAYLVANDCNFLFFGPIEGAQWVLPACALVDAVNVYGARHLGISPGTESHPIYKVL